MFADVTFSSESLSVVTGIVLALVSAIVLNYRLLMQSHNERFAEMRENCARELTAVAAERDAWKQLAEERGKV